MLYVRVAFVTVCACFTLFFSEPILAISYGNAQVSSVVSVYDGDTFRCHIEGYPPIIGSNISIRIAGIDTPEMRDKENKALAQKAREFTKDRLLSAETIKLRDLQRGKYFRLVADVYVDGVSLGELLLRHGLARCYDGGTKERW